MHIVLYLLAAITFIMALFAWTPILIVATAVFLSGGAIVEAIYVSRKGANATQQRHFEQLAEFLDKKLK